MFLFSHVGRCMTCPKLAKKNICDLPKVNKATVLETFNLPKVKKMTQITCLKLIKALLICLTLVDMQRPIWLTCRDFINMLTLLTEKATKNLNNKKKKHQTLTEMQALSGEACYHMNTYPNMCKSINKCHKSHGQIKLLTTQFFTT